MLSRSRVQVLPEIAEPAMLLNQQIPRPAQRHR